MTNKSFLAVEGITHRYGALTALNDVDLDVEQGEFLTFLGPSGCGKTTLLRAIAGLLTPTAGKILLEGTDITKMRAYQRPVNMVFQQNTLFPHLTVAENIAFGLRVSKVPKKAIAAKVDEVLEMVRLDGMQRRKSHELSGGQRQRVNLARAIVNRPKILLLDEPLSALDLKIRLEMEVELRRIHRETQSTFIYVTHDQREALALSDRVAVFHHGRIDQIGPARTIYREPATEFTASFVGDANIIPIVASTEDPSVVIVGDGVHVPAAKTPRPERAGLVIRPEDIMFTTGSGLPGVVLDSAYRGAGMSYQIQCDSIDTTISVEVPDRGETHTIGDTVVLSWHADRTRIVEVQ